MSDGKMARMANDIATFFTSYPQDQAVRGVHDHIRSFWTPKMRAALTEAAHHHPESLHPLVVEAMTTASTAKNPTAREAAGPAELGEIGASDAG